MCLIAGALLVARDALGAEVDDPFEPLGVQSNIITLQFNNQQQTEEQGEAQMCQEGKQDPETPLISEEILEEARKSPYGKVISQERHKLGTNCVSYVRDKHPEIPLGMWNLNNKKEIINSQEPEAGAVAITPESSVGHLAIVVEVLEDGLIIEEGNYIHGYKTLRKISKDLPLGYFTTE